jgi:hypothetical protein
MLIVDCHRLKGGDIYHSLENGTVPLSESAPPQGSASIVQLSTRYAETMPKFLEIFLED